MPTLSDPKFGASLLSEYLRSQLTRFILVPQPAVATDVISLVPGGSTWLLMQYTVLFTASAAAANRNPVLDIRDGDNNTVGSYGISTTYTATDTRRMTWAVGLGVGLNASGIQAPLPSPPFAIPSGFTIRTTTQNIQAADQYGSAVIAVVELAPGLVEEVYAQVAQEFEALA